MNRIRLVTKNVEEFALEKPFRKPLVIVTPKDTVGYVRYLLQHYS